MSRIEIEEKFTLQCIGCGLEFVALYGEHVVRCPKCGSMELHVAETDLGLFHVKDNPLSK